MQYKVLILQGTVLIPQGGFRAPRDPPHAGALPHLGADRRPPPPRCISSPERRGVNRIVSKAGPCARSHASTTPTTSLSGGGWATSRISRQSAEQRLLRTERLSRDRATEAQRLADLDAPEEVRGQRTPALRFGDARLQAQVGAVLAFAVQREGFRQQQLWERVAGCSSRAWTSEVRQAGPTTCTACNCPD